MTDAEMALLGLLAEQPRYGYEIDQIIEARGMREWADIGFSSIYYLLKKLEGADLIRGGRQGGGAGPARKVYRLTSAGRRALHAGTLAALSVPIAMHARIQVGLANLPGVSSAEAARALRRYRRQLADRLRGLAATQASQQPLPYFVDAMFDHSLSLIEAEAAWLERFILRLDRRSARESRSERGRHHAQD
jgi:DNA-binding PadR family transcriptional regulator